MTQPLTGPGIHKARAFPLLTKRTLELWQSSDYRVRELFEQADVMSEGACRLEKNGQVYYGTTSILLPMLSLGGLVPDTEVPQISRLLECDPHARVRAIRIACREAQVRANLPLGQLRAELRFSSTLRGVQIDVDVEAAEKRSMSTALTEQPRCGNG